MPKKRAAGFMLAAAAGLMLLSTPATASASDEVRAPSSTERFESEMTFSGFDSKVAAANGYKIVALPDGREKSVAVRPEARNLEKRLSKSSSVAKTEINGPCGKSWIDITSHGQRKVVLTGYTVPRPVISKLWITQIYGGAGLPSKSWIGPGGATWSSSWSLFYTGGGFINITPGSNVVMSNGTVCLSGSPGENF